jgi:WD40 repeat protein
MKWLVLHLLLAIATCSPDLSILATDVETGSAIARLEDAHRWECLPCSLHIFLFILLIMLISCFECMRSSGAINRLINLSETTIASGDDDGCIKVWDTRQRSCCNSFAAHQDYVSDMSFASDSMKLLGTRYSSPTTTVN